MNITDQYQRKIDYLRISITDHCNLSCIYCCPMEGRPQQPHREILSFEEILTIVRAAVDIGISKIRVTGGEPLVRRNILTFCQMLADTQGIESVAITTNGILLADLARPLAQAGVKRVNISLDTLKPERFKQVSGADRLSDVLAGIQAAEEAGLFPIKINTVMMRGINDDEIKDFVQMALDKPLHIRFIELMPTDGWAESKHRDLFMPVEKIMERVERLGDLKPCNAGEHFGPAQVYTLPGAKGKVGFIAPLSRHFCGHCNRLRLTADGQIKPCLFSQDEIDLKTPLRSGASQKEITEIFKSAVAHKPRGHRLGQGGNRTPVGRGMQAIGG